MTCFIGGCGKPVVEKNLSITEENSLNAAYKEEHLSLGVEYENVVVKNDTIYGVYKTEDNFMIIYQDKYSGNIKKQIPLSNDIKVLSIQSDNEGNVYFVAERDGINRFYKIEESGQYSELVELDISQNGKILKEEAKGIFISDQGYYYIWWNAGIPAKEILEEYAKDNNVYIYVDLIYIMNENFEVVHIEKIPMYKGNRLLDLQLGKNGEILLFLKEVEEIYVKELSLEGTSQKENKIYLGKNTSSESPNLFTTTNDGILYCKGNVLYEYDLDRKVQVELLNLTTYGLLQEEVMYIGKFEDTIEILDKYKGNGISEYTTLIPGASTKQILTLAVMEQSVTMQQVVAEYNRFSKDYLIEVIEYYTEDGGYEAASQRLRLEIISGKAPDIIDVSNVDVSVLSEKGVLVDLYSLMEKDTSFAKERLINNIIEAYEMDGKLYCLAPAFQLVTMWGNNQILQNRSGVSIRELIELLDNHGKDLNAIWGFSADESVLTTLCTFGMDEFIDWNNATCDFRTDYFKDVLEFAKGYTNAYENSQSEGIKENAIAITVGVIDSVSDYQLAKALYGEDVNFIGYPTNVGTGTAVSFRGEALSINAKNNHINGAWDFIKFYITNGYDGIGFPTEKVQFEACMSLAMQPDIEIDENGMMYECVKEWYSDGNVSIKIYEASENDIEAIRELIDSACSKYEYDVSIMKIISEEAEAYLIGQRELEEVTEIIQNRVSLYLDELNEVVR